MKKVGILILVILVFGVWGLWYVGGKTSPTTPTTDSNPVAADPLQPARRPGNWEQELVETFGFPQAGAADPNQQATVLVIDALKNKQNPLLPVDILTNSNSKTYELSDLKLVSETEAVMKSYAKRLSDIVSVYRAPALGYEIKLILEIAEQGKKENLPGLIAAAQRYQSSIDQLLALTVPKNAGQLHLNIINTLSKLLTNARLMTHIQTEPAVALGVAQLQTGNLRPFLNHLGLLNLFFAAQNIEFITDNNTITVIEP